MLWHLAFGVEAGVDALLSPTHLLLALGGAIIMSGPWHALWHHDSDYPAQHPWLVIFSMTFVLSLLAFMTQFAHPFHHPWVLTSYQTMPADSGQSIGVASIMIQTVLFMGLILMTLRRLRFPFGGFTLLLGLNSLLMISLQDKYQFLLPAVGAAVVIEVLYLLIKPSAQRSIRFRLFAILVPVIFYAVYVLTVIFTEGTWWSIHLLGGAIAISGITGLLLSYLVLAPAQAESI